jgi:hypothetical protein
MRRDGPSFEILDAVIFVVIAAGDHEVASCEAEPYALKREQLFFEHDVRRDEGGIQTPSGQPGASIPWAHLDELDPIEGDDGASASRS